MPSRISLRPRVRKIRYDVKRVKREPTLTRQAAEDLTTRERGVDKEADNCPINAHRGTFLDRTRRRVGGAALLLNFELTEEPGNKE
jgi:hypothetical protein